MLAAALGITIILISGGAAAEASSASQYCHHQQSYVADQVRRGLQPRQTGSGVGTGAGAGANVQVFSGALGGIRAAAVTTTGDALRPYAVCGDTFMDFASAAARSCDDQMNSCAEVANAGGANFSVGDCETQASRCNEAIKIDSTTTAAPVISSAIQTTTPVSLSLVSQNANFDYFCEV